MSDEPKLNKGVSPDIAHALLQANPALRQKGVSTNVVVEQSKKLETAGDKEAKAKGPLLVELKVLKQQLANAEKKIADERAALEAERRKVHAQILAKVTELMGAADAGARDKAALAESAFLDAIGFRSA
jgi:hypothetical protein